MTNDNKSTNSSKSVENFPWLAAVLAIPILAAIAAALGFRGSDVLLGVDLGTTYSAVALSTQFDSLGLSGSAAVQDSSPMHLVQYQARLPATGVQTTERDDTSKRCHTSMEM
ncbi:MAG: hypothetical protein EBY22_16650 [Gammaproteobacteria bacterium]|nr:hypothetical protein [Gammaproteobacteria bacterium]